MRNFFDTLEREHVFNVPPRRVVSLVPSDTLTLVELGCGESLIGRTDYCELPADDVGRLAPDAISKLTSVGGTKNASVEAIAALAPDLVLANKEENTKSDLEKLVKMGIRVYIGFPRTVAEGIGHLARLARIFHRENDPDVKALVKEGYDVLREAEEARKSLVPLRTFCPIWMSPLMTMNGKTYMSDTLDLCGAQNVFADRERRYPLAADLGKANPLPPDDVAGRDTRYPRVTLEEVESRAPELVLLPDEPHPFSEEDAKVFLAQRTEAAKRGAVVRTPGKDISWYGSRAIKGIPRLRATIQGWRS